MVRTVHILLSVCLAVLTVAGCSSFMGEPAAKADATPPPGYNPIFLKQVVPMPPTAPPKATAQITGIDTRNSQKVVVTLHVADSLGTYFSQTDPSSLKKLICKVTEKIGNEEIPIQKFTIRQRTESDPVQYAIALVMDNSGSMGDPRARTVQDAAEILIKKKQQTDALALVRYDHKVQIEAPLQESSESLLSLHRKNGLFGFGGGTAILDGTGEAIAHLNSFASPSAIKAVVVFTDGQENSSKATQTDVIKQALKSNTPVYAVDFGAGVNEGYMEGLARATGGYYWHIYRTSEFPDLFEDIYRRLRNGYVIEFTPTTYGNHTVNITLCWGSDTLQASGTYNNTPDLGTVVLLDAYFDTGKSVLKPESRRAIANVAGIMKALPEVAIELRGHTDSTNNTKDSQFNLKLSQQRAEAVKDALVKSGIEAGRITAKGFGDTMPVNSNATEEGRARNRRTEFVFLKAP